MRVRGAATVAAGIAAAALVVGGVPPAAPAAAADQAPGFTLASVSVGAERLVLRWNPCQAAITYTVNARHAARTAAGRRSAVRDARQAVDQLAAATGMTFTYSGATGFLPTGDSWDEAAPAEVVIAWVDQRRPSSASTLLVAGEHRGWAAGTGGLAYRRWSVDGGPWSGAIGRGFVVVNARVRGVRPGFGAGLTRGNLLLHELGHVVGLEHTDVAGQLMEPVLHAGTPSGYAAGDLAGLALVGRPAGCIDVPASVWPDQ